MNETDADFIKSKPYRRHMARAHGLATGRRARSLFQSFAQNTSAAVGRPWAFSGAVFIVFAWAATGPLFHYSDTWQLVINTGTTIITFLMVFLIQNAQNRDSTAMRLKLDELILATRTAHNLFVDIENLDDDQLQQMEQELHALIQADRARIG
jgi:low affinity Fe/Cu permease